MPAKTESQRRLFGMVLSFKRGELKLSAVKDLKLRQRIRKMASTMSIEQLRDFASSVE